MQHSRLQTVFRLVRSAAPLMRNEICYRQKSAGTLVDFMSTQSFIRCKFTIEEILCHMTKKLENDS